MSKSDAAALMPETLIPEQHNGIHKELHEVAELDDAAAAAAVFETATARLRNVNGWTRIAAGESAVFQLCDSSGQPLERDAQQGDLVRVRLPGAKRPDGTYDWVQLAQLREGEDPEGHPWIVLTTRPVADPTVPDEDTAHFFDDGSTGTFIIRQSGNRVEGAHYGRNEQPNTDGGLLEKARALVVTIGAFLGMSDVQWRNLVRGLLGLEK